MSRNVEITREAFAAWNRGDLDGWLSAFHPDAVFYPAGVFPDFDPAFEGYDGLARFWDRIHEPWDTLNAEIERIDEDGDVVVIEMRFHGERKGAPAVALTLVTAVRIRDGRATQMLTKTTVDEARRAIAELGPDTSR